MENKILNTDEIKEVRNALSNIGFNWLNNYTYGENYMYKNEELNKAGRILYKHKLYRFNDISDVKNYLNKCEKANEFIEIINKNNYSMNEFDNIMDFIKKHFQEKLNKQKEDLEMQIKLLESQVLNTL